MDIKANHNLSWSRLAVLPLLLGAVTGCVHDDDDNDNGNATASYTVTVTNLTHNQPLTPPAVILHTEGYSPWTLGQSASTGLEKLAEGGDAADFTAEATANSNVITTSTGVDVLLPGASASFNLEAAPNSDLRVSAASMLASTNDAFTGTADYPIGGLAVGETAVIHARAYDAGTEAHSETAASVPAQGGEGYNATRDDLADFVSIHAGVVTQDDGLPTSDLDESHRFIGPVAKIVVSRTQ